MEDLIRLAMDPASWAALITLILMEVVLGIDNLVFISILSNKLPEAQRARARRIGLTMALGMRVALLSTLAFIVSLKKPVFAVAGIDFSWRDLILIAGGLFLVWKATTEIHHTLDPQESGETLDKKGGLNIGFGAAIAQILLLDLVFSVNSILTAVGMTDHLPIMIIAVMVAVVLMMVAANPLADFIHRNPTVVMLALGFLLMIGMTLIAEGFGAHVSKNYIYAAMGFSCLVEGLNMAARSRRAKAGLPH